MQRAGHCNPRCKRRRAFLLNAILHTPMDWFPFQLHLLAGSARALLPLFCEPSASVGESTSKQFVDPQKNPCAELPPSMRAVFLCPDLRLQRRASPARRDKRHRRRNASSQTEPTGFGASSPVTPTSATPGTDHSRTAGSRAHWLPHDRDATDTRDAR